MSKTIFIPPTNTEVITYDIMSNYVNTALGGYLPLSGNSTINGNVTFVDDLIDDELTADTVIVADTNKKLTSSSVTSTTLGYLDATSSIQTQLNSKSSTSVLTPGDHIIASGSDSIANSAILSESGSILTVNGEINITPTSDGVVLSLTNHAGSSIFQVNSITNIVNSLINLLVGGSLGESSTSAFQVLTTENVNVFTVDNTTPLVTSNAITSITNLLYVKPSFGASSAFYVQDPSDNFVFNVGTSQNGEVYIAGVNDISKFSVQTLLGNKIFNVDTSTPAVSIYTFTGIYGPLLVKPSTGLSSAFYVQDPSGNFVLNVRTSGNGEVGIAGVDDTAKFSVQTLTGSAIFNVDTVNQQVTIQTSSDSNRAIQILDSTGNQVFYVATASSGIVSVGGIDTNGKFGVYSSAGATIFSVDTATPAIRANANIVFPTYGTGNYFDQYGNMNYSGATTSSDSYWSVTDVSGGQPFRVYPGTTSSAPVNQVEIIPTTATTNTLIVYDNASDPTLTVGSNGGVEVSGANNVNKFYVQTASSTVIFNVNTTSPSIDLNANTTVTGNLIPTNNNDRSSRFS